MKRVFHLVKEYRGNYPLLNEYVRSLPVERYCSIVCYLSGRPDNNNRLDSIASDIRYLEFDRSTLRRLRSDVILSLHKIIKSENIDIVHCHRHKATVLGILAASFTDVPIVISHVHGLARTRSWNRYLTNWLIFKKVRKIIAVSDSVRQDVIRTNLKLSPEKVITIRNALDITSIDSIKTSKKQARSMLGLSDHDFLFGTVGRLKITKGQSYLIEAFSEVAKHVPRSRLVIIGEGPLGDTLKKKVMDLGISSQVLFTGYRNDVHELLKSFDVFVLPSIAEGLSIALLEAMASRLPVIASKVGGIPEVVDDTCGMLIPPKNSPLLAESMKKMYFLEKQGRHMMADAVRKKIEDEFVINIMHRKLSELYDTLAYNQQ